MGQVTLNYEDSMRILNTEDAHPDAKVVAACFIAFFTTKNHADDINPSTRAIALKLSHMLAAAIYDTQPQTELVED